MTHATDEKRATERVPLPSDGGRTAKLDDSSFSSEDLTTTLSRLQMPQNVEIKAVVRDLAGLEAIAATLADSGAGELLQQHDIFFPSARGRLKMRMVNGAGQLIYYERADEAGPKTSTFEIAPVADFGAMRTTLLAALGGALGEVKKRRMLYLVGQTRVHVDRVEGLGDYMELEVCLAEGQSEAAGMAIAHELKDKLGVAEADLMTGAYTDMLAAKAAAATAAAEGSS
jgi:predicted adenylyl cyclase CyaB